MVTVCKGSFPTLVGFIIDNIKVEYQELWSLPDTGNTSSKDLIKEKSVPVNSTIFNCSDQVGGLNKSIIKCNKYTIVDLRTTSGSIRLKLFIIDDTWMFDILLSTNTFEKLGIKLVNLPTKFPVLEKEMIPLASELLGLDHSLNIQKYQPDGNNKVKNVQQVTSSIIEASNIPIDVDSTNNNKSVSIGTNEKVDKTLNNSFLYKNLLIGEKNLVNKGNLFYENNNISNPSSNIPSIFLKDISPVLIENSLEKDVGKKNCYLKKQKEIQFSL